MIWATTQCLFQLEHPRLDATEDAASDEIEPSSAAENILETTFFCRCDAVAKDKDEDVVEVVRPVPKRVAQLLPRQPRPGKCTSFALKMQIQPQENLGDEKPERRHKSEPNCPTEPPLDC